MADQISFWPLSNATDRKGTVPLTRVTGPDAFKAVAYQCILKEDNDGAPTCYGPDGITPRPLDPLKYATNHANWVFSPTNHNFLWHGLFSRTKKQADDEAKAHRPPRWTIDFKPELQDNDGNFPVLQPSGFYVSTTSTIANGSKERWEQERYMNAAEVAYAAITPALTSKGANLGDVGLAIRKDSGKTKAFFLGDSGNENKVGECSRKLYRHFFPAVDEENHPVVFLVFPGSNTGLSRTDAAIEGAVKKQIAKLSKAGNAYDLGMLFGYPELWRGWLTMDEKLRTKDREIAEFRADSERIMNALAQWGYRPQTGDFPAGKQSAA